MDLNDVRFRGPWPIYAGCCKVVPNNVPSIQKNRRDKSHRVIVASGDKIMDNSGYVHMERFLGQFGNPSDTKWTMLGENTTIPDRSGVELFTHYQIEYAPHLFLFLVWQWQWQPWLKSAKLITWFRSENEADLLNRLFTLGPEHSKKLSDTEPIFSEIGAFQVIIITKIVPDHFNHVWTQGLSVIVYGALRYNRKV